MVRPPASFLPGQTTRAEVDLDVLAGNVRQLRTLTGKASLMAVVKAEAYGHGAVQVARVALAHGADWLGVYAVDEGARLRHAGIIAPILVFGPFAESEARLFVQWNLRPTITSVNAGEWLQKAADGQMVRFHLKVDTGLNRAGVDPEEALPLMRRLEGFPALQVEGLYTHFACADEPQSPVTRLQIQRFVDVSRALGNAGFDFPLKHAANSAALFAFPESHFDLVRTGIAIYGYYPSAQVPRPVPLQPVLHLRSRVTRVHQVPTGAGAGYGHEFVAARDSTIALVPIGYGDGLPRTLGCGRGSVLVEGRPARIVGRVSMDQITVDTTEIPSVGVGSDVTLIGKQGLATQTADDLAEQAGTISYDIVTGLLPRVPRLYLQGGRAVATSNESVQDT